MGSGGGGRVVIGSGVGSGSLITFTVLDRLTVGLVPSVTWTTIVTSPALFGGVQMSSLTDPSVTSQMIDSLSLSGSLVMTCSWTGVFALTCFGTISLSISGDLFSWGSGSMIVCGSPSHPNNMIEQVRSVTRILSVFMVVFPF